MLHMRMYEYIYIYIYMCYMDGILIKLYFWRLYPNLWWSTPTAPSVDYDVGSGGFTNKYGVSKQNWLYIYIYISISLEC